MKSYRWLVYLVLVAAIAVGCSRSTSAGTFTGGVAVRTSSSSGEIPVGDEPPPPFRLSEGVAGYEPGAETPLAETTPLSLEALQNLLARLPAVQVGEKDVQEYALPEESLPPPRPGEEVDLPFPPPESVEAPTVETGPVEVVRFSPEGDVPLAPRLSVTFNQPMVPLTSHEELAKEDVPVRLTPDVPGHWRWVGTKTLFFEADVEGVDRMPMATTYTVEIPAGVKSANGNILEAPVTWTFRTPPPTLEQTYPTGGPQRLDPILFASFDQRMDPEAVLEHVDVKAGGVTFPVRLATEDEIQTDAQVKWLVQNAPEGRWIALKALEDFPKDATVTVTFKAGTPSAEGPRVTEQSQSFSFQTYGPLLVRDHFCSWGGNECPPFTPWTILFTNPLDPDAFDASLIEIDPELSGLDTTVYGNALELRGNTQGRTTYQVTLKAGLTDVFGQQLGKDVTLNFRVGSAQPVLSVPGGVMVVMDPSGQPALSAYSININKLDVEVYAVAPQDFPKFLAFLGDYRRTENLTVPGERVLARTIDTHGAADALTETSIPLAELLPKGTGHLIVKVAPEVGALTGFFNRDLAQVLASYTTYRWVQVTKIGLDGFIDADQFVAWTNNLQDGAPLGGVEVELWPADITGTTDETGVATLPLPAWDSAGASLLIARQGDDTAFIPQSTYFWSRQDGWKASPQGFDTRFYVFDDRAMYRPGETVSIKGWMRRLTRGVDGDVELPPAGDADRVRYRVIDPLGNEVASGEAPLNSLSGFHFQFELPENINLGYSQVEIQAVGGSLESLPGEGYTTHAIQVQEFRRPEFEVTASATEGPHMVGGHAIATVSAKYFAGGPLPNADVDWLVTASPTTYRPPNWNGFVFGTWVPWWRAYSFGGQTTSARFTSRTDAAGEHHLRIDFDPSDPPQPQLISAEATVMDVNRQAWTAGTDLLVHPAALYVGMRSDRFFVARGEPIVVELAVTDLDGNAVAGHPVTVKAARMDWELVHGNWEEVEKDVQTCEVETTGASDPDDPNAEFAACTFETELGGRYQITATVEDDQGRKNQSQITRWVGGAGRPPARNVEQEEVNLIPDGETYQPGDVAEILVQAPFYPAEGMVTLRREGLISTERFTMDGPTYTLKVPIQESYIPNFFVQVDLVGEAVRTDDQGNPREDLPKRPAYATGSLRISVPPLSRTLHVEAAPQADRLEPGGETTIDLTVTDAAGAPVADAELAVVVVDEAILALTNYQLTDPISVFYAGRGAGVEDVHNRANILLASPELLSELADKSAALLQRGAGPPVPSAEAPMAMEAAVLAFGGAEEAAAQPIRVRSNFDPLALFAPEVRTDGDGRASVPVTLPDNLTRYRVMVVAVADGKFFGSGEASITARLPLMVRPSAPRFLNFGDRFQLPVVLQNQTDEPLTVNLAVQASNADLTDETAITTDVGEAAGVQVTVPANDRVEVRIPTQTASAGTARFQFGAAAVDNPAWADAAEVSLPVWTPATTEAFAVYGQVDEGAIAQPLLPPADVIPIYGGLEVSMSSTALQALTDAYLYLMEYPFECSEQVASRILAVAALRDVLTAFDAAGLPPAEEIDAAMARDIQILQALQDYNGGFPIWRRGGEVWPFYSVHAAHALARARIKDYQVPEEMISRSLDYLRNIENYIPSWYSQRSRDSLVAYSLYVRKLLGDVDTGKARSLVEKRGLDNLSLENIGWLLFVLTGDDGSAQTLMEMRRYLANRVTETAGAANFVDSYDDDNYLVLYSNRRADAVILEALMDDQPDSDLIPKLVQGLLAHRTKGRWSNTQENVFVLLALDKYFNIYEAQTPDFVARVWLGDQYAGGHEFVGRTTENVNLNVPMTLVQDLRSQADASGQVPLIVQKDGQGRLYYRLGLRYAPTDLMLDPADHGFTVERVYEPVDDPEDVWQDEEGVWHVKAGARVRVRLTLVAESRRYHVALVDPLPAGLETLNPALAVVGDIPKDPNSQSNRYGWWWWGPWYEHQNLRDERAEAFTSLLWGGVYTYTYVARATTPGEFIAPPAKAEEMYAPETFGRSGTDRLVVED